MSTREFSIRSVVVKEKIYQKQLIKCLFIQYYQLLVLLGHYLSFGDWMFKQNFILEFGSLLELRFILLMEIVAKRNKTKNKKINLEITKNGFKIFETIFLSLFWS